MADPNNPGQFGNRDDTEEQARKGGENSSGQFGAENGADPQEAGQKGAAAQPREAKVEGGKTADEVVRITTNLSEQLKEGTHIPSFS